VSGREVVVTSQSDVFNNLSGKWALLIFVLSAPIFMIFAYFDRSDKGLVAYFSCAIILTLLRASWPLRRMSWFWPVMILATAIHALAVWRISFTALDFPAVILVPFGIVDFLAWFYVVWSLSKRVR